MRSTQQQQQPWEFRKILFLSLPVLSNAREIVQKHEGAIIYFFPFFPRRNYGKLNQINFELIQEGGCCVEKRHCFWAPGKSFESNLGGFFREIKGASEKKKTCYLWRRRGRRKMPERSSSNRVAHKFAEENKQKNPAGQVGSGWCLANEASGKRKKKAFWVVISKLFLYFWGIF